jgi:hypothetical protein
MLYIQVQIQDRTQSLRLSLPRTVFLVAENQLMIPLVVQISHGVNPNTMTDSHSLESALTPRLLQSTQ